MVRPHILLLTFPSQGSLNPSLQFAKNLVKIGVKVTLLASLFVHRRISHTPEGLTLASFSDGYDNGIKLSDDLNRFRSEFKSRSSIAMSELITASAKSGHPITCIVYNMLLSWAAQLARDFNIPSAPLWVQPAAIFDIYFYYFKGYGDEIRKISTDDDSSCPVELPGLPPLTRRDLPTYMLPSKSMNPFALPAFKEQIEILDAEAEVAKPTVLVNTFDLLEESALKAVEKYKLVAVGPLVPSAFLDGKDPSDTEFGGDLLQRTEGDVFEWLDSKPQSSVVYVSFGSFLGVSEKQMEEIARGLLESHRPFLWVIKDTENGDKLVSCKEELERQGMIVAWCSQVEVLSHHSLGCFVTHCGWNSSLETLVCGVPVVGLPQFTDQPINAKLLEDTFKVGVRLTVNEEGIAEGDEIKRCIQEVMGMGEKGEEMRRNAKKWQELAKEATKEGGSSDLNLRAFVDEVSRDF